MRIDCHVHFWEMSSAHRNSAQDFEILRRDFMPGDLAPLMARAAVERVVLVQAARSLDETRDYLALAEREPCVGAVVGWVDLTAPDVAETLATLQGQSAYLSGIREVIQSLPDRRWMLRPAVLAGLRQVRDAGLWWEFLCLSSQLKDSLRVLEQVPGLPTVYNHACKPEIAAGEWEPWASRVREIATHSEALVKLSGLCEMTGGTWTAETFKPYVAHLLEHFGPERVMFATNWPVIHRGGCDYVAWTGLVQGWLDDFGLRGAARDAIMGGNAARVYSVR